MGICDRSFPGLFGDGVFDRAGNPVLSDKAKVGLTDLKGDK